MELKLHSKNILMRMVTIVTIATLTVMSLLLFVDANNDIKAAEKPEQQSVPTFYLHGHSGSEKSMRYLIQSAVNKGVTKNVIKAHVSADGNVTFEGDINSNDPHPIVQIILEDNKNWDYEQNAVWLKNVITETNKHMEFNKFNMVAHSMGNLTLSYYMLNYGDDNSLPQLNKQVDTGAPLNGILGRDDKPNRVKLDENSKPDKMTDEYKELQQMKYNYPQQSVEVLNIYGDLLDGTHSDGKVTTQSSLSLKYLLDGYVKSYRTFKVEGEHGEHSALHDYNVVAEEVNAFLWNE